MATSPGAADPHTATTPPIAGPPVSVAEVWRAWAPLAASWAVMGLEMPVVSAVIARLALPTLLVQEGGYLSPELGENLVSFLDGFEGAR